MANLLWKLKVVDELKPYSFLVPRRTWPELVLSCSSDAILESSVACLTWRGFDKTWLRLMKSIMHKISFILFEKNVYSSIEKI